MPARGSGHIRPLVGIGRVGRLPADLARARFVAAYSGGIRMEEFPPLVVRANALARRVGFAPTRQEADDTCGPSGCVPWVGRLLGVLAAGCHEGRIGEIGTGVGVGSAWMASSMPADCLLVTVEIDRDMAAHASNLLADDRRVMVLTGDAGELLPTCAPYDLLYADGGYQDPASYGSLIDLIRIGGQIVMDDVTDRVVAARLAVASQRHKARFLLW